MLDSVKRYRYPSLEVIIVDNGSNADPGPALQELHPDILYLRSEVNLGFAGGNNLGIRHASGDYVFLVNNDTELTEGLIETLVKVFLDHPEAGSVTPLICYFPERKGEPELIQFAGCTSLSNLTGRNLTFGSRALNNGQFKHLTETAYAHGAAMMVPRKVATEVGLMSERFFLYYEELDWSEQIRKAGYKHFVQPAAKIYHKESASIGPMSPVKTHYLTRNRWLFMRRHRQIIPLTLFSVYLLLAASPVHLFRFLIRGQWAHLAAWWRALAWNFTHAAYEPKKADPPMLSAPKAGNKTGSML